MSIDLYLVVWWLDKIVEPAIGIVTGLAIIVGVAAWARNQWRRK